MDLAWWLIMTQRPRAMIVLLLASFGVASAVAFGIHERSAHALSCAAPPRESVELELLDATVDGVLVADTPVERRTATLTARADLALANGTTVVFTREGR
jgi:hypothetical protein